VRVRIAYRWIIHRAQLIRRAGTTQPNTLTRVGGGNTAIPANVHRPRQMPLSYEIDQDRRLVFTAAWDTVTGAEALELQRQLRSNPRFNPDFFQLLDLARVTSVSIDRQTMTEIAVRHSFSAKSRRAFVVGSNKFVYGMARMFIALSRVTGNEEMRVFKNRDEALQWLGVAPFD